MRRGEGKENRKRISRIAMSNPKLAAGELRAMADSLEQCKNTSDTIFALGEIFCVSERTIFRDLL